MLALAFALLVAGCASTPEGDPAAAATPAAAQLAADINAIKAGSAKVSGDTVTLTGGLRLETALTVPAGVTLAVAEGVTLDLAADGAALTFGNNAVLTVNGAVNVRSHIWKGIAGSLLVDRAMTINGNGIINLKSKGELLYIGKSQKLTLDGVTLAGLEDNDDSLVMVYDGGELVMIRGAITGNTRTGAEWSAAGGVQVDKNSTFTMHGGAISDNTVNGKWAYGGGVWAAEGSTFIMSGGAVSGNTTKGNGHASGGGVRVEDGVTFTMSGGEISGNKVIGTSGGGSGGVDVTNALFTMKGGTISGNSVTAPYSSGGGVSVCGNDDGSGRATFIMEGGAIFGNVTASPINRAMSGGVDVRYSNFTMKGGRIQGNTDSDGFTKNTGSHENATALFVWDTTAKWGTGGVYTKGGIPQTSGGDIVPIEADSSGRTNDTLIAVSGK